MFNHKEVNMPDPSSDAQRTQEKLARAKELLGERYLCHPANRVKIKRAPETPPVDVARTVSRFLKQARDLV